MLRFYLGSFNSFQGTIDCYVYLVPILFDFRMLLGRNPPSVSSETKRLNLMMVSWICFYYWYMFDSVNYSWCFFFLDDKPATLRPPTLTTICSLETGSFTSRRAGLNCARAHAKQKAPGTIVNIGQLPCLVWSLSPRIHHNLSCRCFYSKHVLATVISLHSAPLSNPKKDLEFRAAVWETQWRVGRIISLTPFVPKDWKTGCF